MKTFPGMKFCNKFALSWLEIIAKDQYFRVSREQFLKSWLFGPEKLTGLWRNSPQAPKKPLAVRIRKL